MTLEISSHLPSKYLPVQKPVARFIQDVLTVKENGQISIFTGSAHPDLYNHPFALEALSYAVNERGTSIRVMTGPLLMVDESGTNGLLRLSVKDYYALKQAAEKVGWVLHLLSVTNIRTLPNATNMLHKRGFTPAFGI